MFECSNVLVCLYSLPRIGYSVGRGDVKMPTPTALRTPPDLTLKDPISHLSLIETN